MPAIDVQLSAAASQALRQRNQPLVVELELLFSCLVRKRVLFPAQIPAGSYPLASSEPGLVLHFHPIVSHHCKLEGIHGEQAKDDLPLANPAAFTPRWLRLDFRHGEWWGDFGYARDS